jgi:hypothetical protein
MASYFVGKILCALPRKLGGGHRRGKRVGKNFEDGGLRLMTHNIVFYCPRCFAEWDRKPNKVKPKATYEFKIAPENVAIPAEAFKDGVVLNVTATTGTPTDGSET